MDKIIGHISARKRVANEVLDQLISGLESGEITIEQARAIAHETLAALDQIEKHEDIIVDFYKKLADRYPAFKLLYTRVKGEILKAREMAHYRSALVAIEAGDVAGANEILKSAIEQTANETAEIE